MKSTEKYAGMGCSCREEWEVNISDRKRGMERLGNKQIWEVDEEQMLWGRERAGK